MSKIKLALRDCLRSFGIDIRHYKPEGLGVNPFRDLQHLLHKVSRPVILDVGANVGQTVDNFKKAFPDSLIHSFEPGPGTYAELAAHCAGMKGVTPWNCAVGSRPAVMPFLEYTGSDMSSFLKPGPASWSKVEKVTEVEVVTLDEFASKQGIDFVHLLKSDTQGYDLEVLKGSENLMKAGRIGYIYFEFTFSALYEKSPPFDAVFRFLADRNFSLVSFYDPHFKDDVLSWIDVLAVHNDYNRERIKQAAGGDAS